MIAGGMLTNSIAVIVGLIIGWLVRHYFKTPGFKSDTTRFFRQSGSHVKLYTPATLRFVLYASLASVNFSDETVAKWEALEEHGKVVSQRQYERFRLGNGKAVLLVAVAFIDQSLSKANRKREEENTRPPTLG